MARRLNDDDIATAVRLLDGWTGKLTWERYLAFLAIQLGGRTYTKAGLRKQPRILGAWELARKRLVESLDAVGASCNGDAAVAQLRTMLQRHRNENARLEQENRDLLERFARWTHNAAMDKGMTLAQLDRDIVRPDRTDGRPKVVR